MANLGSGLRWERLRDEERDAENRNAARRRHEETEQRRALIGNLPSLTDFHAHLSTVSQSEQYFTAASRNSGARQNLSELDTNQLASPLYRQQAPPSPPASEIRSSEEEEILELQQRVTHQAAHIQKLESELGLAKRNIQRLKTERHEAKEEEQRAVLNGNNEEIGWLSNKVAGLVALLDRSKADEKKLEREVDEGKEKEQGLRKQLDIARRTNRELENDVEARRSREALMRQRLEDEQRVNDDMDDAIEIQRRQTQGVRRNLQHLAQNQDVLAEEVVNVKNTRTPSVSITGRSIKADRAMRKNGYVVGPSKRPEYGSRW